MNNQILQDNYRILIGLIKKTKLVIKRVRMIAKTLFSRSFTAVT